jgi:AsmA protein
LQLNQLKLTDFTQPNISTGIELTDFNLKKWLPLFKLPPQNTLDKSALTQVNLKADLRANLQQLQLQNVAMQLDQTHIKGQVTLTDFANPRISLSLEADKFDADRYMPPANPNQKPTQPLLPLELLKVLNIKGHIKLRKLTVTQMQLQDINLQFIE